MASEEPETADAGATTERKNFLQELIEADLESGRDGGRVQTRFPPEPNGFLHIGHATSIYWNFRLAEEYGGVCSLRFDDTNPTRESDEFVRAIQEDVRWLGFDWGERLFFASDYFEQLYGFARELCEKGLAYVDDQTVEEIRKGRGSRTEPGVASPCRDRSPAENLDLFERMRKGEFEPGARVLRAKIDMASPNLQLRDPVLYRIMKEHHHRTGDAWCIYPTYDWAHGQSDAIEGVTHSLCTLEFENHRPLYEWCLANISAPSHPRQTEFARFNLTYTIVAKRHLKHLVENGLVSGWDDPRMPTLSGMRRRGYTPESVRSMCRTVGVTRVNGRTDMVVLENALREDLNRRALRRLVVLDPIKLVIENWEEGHVEEFDAIENPEDESAGTRKVSMSREVWVERDDFREEAPRKWRRLSPGKEVRLRYACYVTVTDVVKNEAGEVTELRATWDPESRGGGTPDGRKVRGTIHWVSVLHGVPFEVRLFDHLFREPNPTDVPEGGHFTDNLNPDSLKVVEAIGEPSLAQAEAGAHYQFERSGYFCVDTVDSQPGRPVFNRSVALRDSWAKIEKNQS